MISSTKLKSVDFYRKIPKDLTEASLSGAGLSIIAALAMIILFVMELKSYLTITTVTSIIVDQSTDGEYLRLDFNISFPALSCEFASVDVSDVLGTNRLNITKTVRKYSIDPHLNPTGPEFHSGPVHDIKHGEEFDGEVGPGSVPLDSRNFDQYSQLFPVLVVNFFAPWCYWSNRLKPSWETAAKMVRERYDPQMDGRILLGSVDCTQEVDLCKRHHIQGYPSIRVFRKGSDLKEERGHHDHEAYYGDRDTDSLFRAMENLVSSLHMEPHKSDNKTLAIKRPAPLTGGCRVEGHVRVNKVPGNLIIQARSGAHSFDPSQMNMSHVISYFTFGVSAPDHMWLEARKFLPFLGQSHDKLKGKSFINHHPADAKVTIEHYLKIVKTEVRIGDFDLPEYEYTAHSSLVESILVPAAKFHFEPSPMQVFITEKPRSFSHFLTNVCAIIGGVFTVAGILDSIFHHSVTLMKKIELGKNF